MSFRFMLSRTSMSKLSPSMPEPFVRCCTSLLDNFMKSASYLLSCELLTSMKDLIAAEKSSKQCFWHMYRHSERSVVSSSRNSRCVSLSIGGTPPWLSNGKFLSGTFDRMSITNLKLVYFRLTFLYGSRLLIDWTRCHSNTWWYDCNWIKLW